MKTEIIILAQGIQSRLPEVKVPKQWLPLPACADTPILHRTLVQLWELSDGGLFTDWRVSVITWPRLRHYVVGNRIRVRMNDTTGYYKPTVHTLIDAGNSSLKGAKAALHDMRGPWDLPAADRTVILLGDVVYSWKCLELLLDDSHRGVTVCGTSDLSPSDGELWGISWHRERELWVRNALDRALEKHPPFTDYQPGQLRRWFWAMCDLNMDSATAIHVGNLSYQKVDDYTDDVDVPEDVKNLPAVAVAAAADDLTRGITWPIS